ncbi:succinate dehydrogenase (ubiquinone) cytochrome b560 subunit [Paragonimus westermani]|uniref:Succinate dehydrogenase (Ubiquinone) cytochrome b560 subunit n=1 Tax=Paragonimus westermani TaxID=34504 RepID=A0A5J4NFA9_9TREM|nr:succinate dehydrogenase (ubiquinone) cytochrome b560 subunit [Paragonimus westermani]
MSLSTSLMVCGARCGRFSAPHRLYTHLSYGQKGLSRLNVTFRTLPKFGTKGISQKVRGQAEKEMQSFWAKNFELKRPWSPHLLIYSPPAVMRFSFLHRATGIAMAFVWTSVGCGAFWFAGHYDAMLDYVRNLHLGYTIITCCKFVLCYPLVYHYLNGMRHLAWDYAIGFPIKTCNTTGAIVTALSLVVAAGLAVLKI